MFIKNFIPTIANRDDVVAANKIIKVANRSSYQIPPGFPVLFVTETFSSANGGDIFNYLQSDGGNFKVYSSTSRSSATRLPVHVVTCDPANSVIVAYVRTSNSVSPGENLVVELLGGGVEVQPSISASFGQYEVWRDYSWVTTDGGKTNATHEHKTPILDGGVSVETCAAFLINNLPAVRGETLASSRVSTRVTVALSGNEYYSAFCYVSTSNQEAFMLLGRNPVNIFDLRVVLSCQVRLKRHNNQGPGFVASDHRVTAAGVNAGKWSSYHVKYNTAPTLDTSVPTMWTNGIRRAITELNDGQTAGPRTVSCQLALGHPVVGIKGWYSQLRVRASASSLFPIASAWSRLEHDSWINPKNVLEASTTEDI